MAWCLFRPNYHFNQYCINVNWTPRNKFQWNFNKNTGIFIKDYAVEDVVYNMLVIFQALIC